MVVRSAPAQRLLERPKISFVFPVHDPEYGGDLLGRTQRHIDALIELANRYRLLSEIIIVEWNPRQDRAPFRESLHWPDDLGHVCLRFLEVPAEIHRRLPNADRIPIFEYIAKNAGLRRARGQFLLATNPDLFYSPALVRWLARASLSPETFYRVDRQDLSEEIPSDLSLSRRLRFCSQHVAHVHALFGSYEGGDAAAARRLSDEYDQWLHGRGTDTPDPRLILPADGLHRNAAGDFFLMERDWWHRLRGYPELYTHAHIDAILCWMAASAGLTQEVLPARCHLYHQAHHRASHGGFPQTDWKPWYERYREAVRPNSPRRGSPMVVNLPDWGLANEVLPEWEAGPRLVQVQAVSGELNEDAQRVLTQRLTQAETLLAWTRTDLQRTTAWLEAAAQTQANLRAAWREARSAYELERASAQRKLHRTQRAHKLERSALEAALHQAEVAHRSEAALRRNLESSTAWRITGPIRRALTSFASLRRAVRPSPRRHDVKASRLKGNENSLTAKPKQGQTRNPSPPPASAPAVGLQVSSLDSSAPVTKTGAPVLPQSLSERIDDSLRVFHVPGDAPRVSLVADSINASSLFGGMAIAVVMAALLARHLGARLRVITLTEPPEPGNVADVFSTHRIPWSSDIEFVHVGPERQEEVPVADDELFLTTSWKSTRCVLPMVDPRQVVYLVQQDDRLSYAQGDDRLRCVETLSDSNVRFVVNGRGLFEHLTGGPDALPNVLAHGVWFEPAFPSFYRKSDEIDPAGGKRQLFFYAQPNNLLNLYWRGLDAIGAAVQEDVLDPAEWTFHVAGPDTVPVELPRGVRTNMAQNLPWQDYVKLVRRIDVGLCLMEAPHPRDLPLNLAASGGVIVTNQHGGETSLAAGSTRIIRVESGIESLKGGIVEAVARAANRNLHQAEPDAVHINRDWEVALAPVLAALYPDRRLS